MSATLTLACCETCGLNTRALPYHRAGCSPCAGCADPINHPHAFDCSEGVIMATHTFNPETGRFTSIKSGKELGIVAKKSRCRWQYRDEQGRLYASGMEPAQFVAQFWYGTLAD